MNSLANALLKAGLVNREQAAEADRERRNQEQRQAEENLQRLSAPKAHRGRDETQAS